MLAREAAGAAQLLRAVDERQQNVGDWRSVVYLEQRETGRDLLVYETVSMRRSADRKFVMLFSKPKTVAGQSADRRARADPAPYGMPHTAKVSDGAGR